MRNALTPNDAAETRYRDAQEAEDEAAARYWADRDRFGHHTPFYLRCPLNAIEGVARGLRAGTVRFLARHVIEVGGDRWDLDGNLELWQKARAFANQLNHQGYLEANQGQGELVYQKKGGKNDQSG